MKRKATNLRGFCRQAIVLAVIVALGVVVLSVSRAATPAASIESENGVRTANAVLATCSGASGVSTNNCIRFTSAATVPGQCASGGTYLWSHLESCGWPGPANTGYDASQCPGGALNSVGSSMSQVITISANNSTYSCKKVTGCLYVTGTNVTISNVKITCDSGKKGTAVDDAGPEGHGGIYIEDGASATIASAEIDAHKGTHACVWHQGTSLSISKLNCYNADDGIFSWSDTNYSQTTGDNFTIKDSYFHDFTKTTSNGHIDGYQTEGAANGLIDHNTFYMTSDDSNYTDSSIAIWNSLRSSHDITVKNNLLTGGSFSVYAQDYSGPGTNRACSKDGEYNASNNPGGAINGSGCNTVTNIIFTNNSFSTILKPSSQCVGFGQGWDGGVWVVKPNFPPYQGAATDGWHRSGNKVLETGENIDNSNPHFPNGALCS